MSIAVDEDVPQAGCWCEAVGGLRRQNPQVGSGGERIPASGRGPTRLRGDQVGVDVDGEVDGDLEEPLARRSGDRVGAQAWRIDAAQPGEISQCVGQGT
jgi:hypothetical protein